MRRAHQRLLQLAPVGREACSADALRARQHAVAPPRAPDSSGTAPAHRQREREREGETRCVRVAGYTYARCVGLLFPQPVCEKIKQNRQNASWLAKRSPAALRMSHPNRHHHPRQPLRRVAALGRHAGRHAGSPPQAGARAAHRENSTRQWSHRAARGWYGTVIGCPQALAFVAGTLYYIYSTVRQAAGCRSNERGPVLSSAPAARPKCTSLSLDAPWRPRCWQYPLLRRRSHYGRR